MRYKGYNFRVSRTVVMLQGYYDPKTKSTKNTSEGGAYVRFGKFCAANVPGAELTNYTMPPTEEHPERVPLYAKPLEMTGYSLTNMAYGKDGKVYLAKDGSCFTALQVKSHCEGTQLDWKKVPGGLDALLRVPCESPRTVERLSLGGEVIHYCDVCAQMYDLNLKIEAEVSAS